MVALVTIVISYKFVGVFCFVSTAIMLNLHHLFILVLPFCTAPVRAERHVTYWSTPVRVTEERDERSNQGNHGNQGNNDTENAAQLSGIESSG